jgi:hypothetical protein
VSELSVAGSSGVGFHYTFRGIHVSASQAMGKRRFLERTSRRRVGKAYISREFPLRGESVRHKIFPFAWRLLPDAYLLVPSRVGGFPLSAGMPLALSQRPLAMKPLRSLPLWALVGASLFVFSSRVSAVPLTYTVSGLDAPDAPGGGEFVVNTSATPAQFTLSDPGEGTNSFEFDFFTITPSFVGGGSFDPVAISAVVSFSDPAVLPVSFDGTFRSFFPLLVFPVTSQLITASDRTFSLDLLIDQVTSGTLGRIFTQAQK